MYDHVLLPTDGSRAAEAAADHAFDIARRSDAAVSVLYVVDESIFPVDIRADQYRVALESEGQRAVDELVARAKEAGVEQVSGAVESGAPTAAVLDYADAHGCDLVVMGTHGRSGIERVLLGSVAERVVRKSPVAILTVRPADG